MSIGVGVQGCWVELLAAAASRCWGVEVVRERVWAKELTSEWAGWSGRWLWLPGHARRVGACGGWVVRATSESGGDGSQLPSGLVVGAGRQAARRSTRRKTRGRVGGTGEKEEGMGESASARNADAIVVKGFSGPTFP